MDNPIPINFIVTRPINRATNLVKTLQSVSTFEHPFQVFHCPLIRIAEFIDQDFFAENENSRLHYDGVIFISGNAVDSAKQQLSDIQWQQLLSSPLFAIGEQTARILQAEVDSMAQQNHSRVKFPKIMNSEGLLAMDELSQIEVQSWLIVKGLGGRDKLKRGLISAGAQVTELAVYQRKLPDLFAQKEIMTQSLKNPFWLITSSQALNNLYRILNREIQGCRIIVSSDRIADEANRLGFIVIAQSVDATDKQLAECVKHFIRNEAQV